MTSRVAARAAWAAFCAAAGLSFATPAWAARDILIDLASQSNTLTACGAFTGCLYTSIGGAGGTYVSPTGFIDIADFAGGYARFSIGAGTTNTRRSAVTHCRAGWGGSTSSISTRRAATRA